MITDFIPKFLEFAKSKPANERYDALHCKTCALGQFVISQGYDPSSNCYYLPDWTKRQYPQIALSAALKHDTWGEVVTYLKRRIEP